MINRMTKMNVNHSGCKVTHETTNGLQYAVYILKHHEMNESHYIMHWHKDFEIDMSLNGGIHTFVDGREIEISDGDCLFLNSNVLHGSQSYLSTNGGSISIFFDPAFIAGSEGDNTFWDKLIRPFIVDNFIRSIVLSKTVPWQKQCIDYVYKVYELAQNEPPFFEFEIRETLTRFLVTIYCNGEPQNENAEKRNCMQINTMLITMLDFVANSYTERITVDDIAEAANISARECYRKFSQYLRTSPTDYINAVRIQQACRLLREGKQSITDIGLSVGFSSSSYFATKFKREIGCTPQEYKHNNKRR